MTDQVDALITRWQAARREIADIERTLGERLPPEVGSMTAAIAILTVARFAPVAPKISEVAAALGHKPATATEVIDRLESAGLLARVAHPTDRRLRLLALTDAGVALIARIREAFADEGGDDAPV